MGIIDLEGTYITYEKKVMGIIYLEGTNITYGILFRHSW